MARKTSGSCASGISEGCWVVLLVFDIWRLLSIKCGLQDGTLPCLAPGHDVPSSMTSEKRVKENPTQEHQFLEQHWLAERANTAIIVKHNLGRYRVWVGHSFHSQLCPLPLPVVSLIMWCSPKSAQTLPQPILILSPTQEDWEAAVTWVEAALSSDGLFQVVQTMFSWHPRATLSSGSFGQESKEQNCSEYNYRRGEKIHIQCLKSLAAGDVSIGKVTRTSTNDSKHFVKWNSQMMSELRLL